MREAFRLIRSFGRTEIAVLILTGMFFALAVMAPDLTRDPTTASYQEDGR